jgi:hypothetical protein
VGRTQIIIAKHRNGAIADIDMRFRADEVRFVDEQENLVNQAAELTGAPVMPGYQPIGSMAVDDFGTNDEFSM